MRIMIVAAATCLLTLFGTATPAMAGDELHARVTFYLLPGIMASGQRVHHGAAACSQWIPFGTRLEFHDGRVVQCLDRGHGDQYWNTRTGYDAWVDVWTSSYQAGIANIESVYGTRTNVTVLRWGWTEPEPTPDHEPDVQ